MGWKPHIREVNRMTKKKLWCFMKAFSYPLSLAGMFLLIFLGVATERPEIIGLIVIPAGLTVTFLFLIYAVKELLGCYEDYRSRVREIEKIED